MNGQQLKNSILQMAVEGKLVPQNENDEPASILIDRIAKEKEQLVKDKKIKKNKNVSRIFQGEEDSLWYEEIGKGEIKCIEEELPFGLPKGWSWCRLGSVFMVEMGQSPKGDTVSEYNKGIEFHQGKVCFGKKYLKESPQKTTAPTKFALANSLLLCVRAPVGKVNITDREICIGRGLCSIMTLDRMNINYVFYLLEMFENIFIKKATGTTFIAITGEVVKSQLIPLPPLAEQQRIVSKIEKLLPLVDDYGVAHSKLEKLNSDFPSDLKKSLLQWAVQGKLVPQNENDEPASVLIDRIAKEKEQLVKDKKIKKDKNVSRIFQGEDDGLWYEEIGKGSIKCIEEELPFDLPMGWSWCRLGSVVSVLGDGLHGTPLYNELGEYFFVNGNNLSNGNIIIKDNTKKVDFNEYEKYKKVLNSNSILISINGTIGNIAFYNNEKIILGKSACYFNILNDINKYYLKNLFESNYFIIYATFNATGSTIKNVSLATMKNFLLPLPPLAEQHRIVEKLESVLSEIEKL